MTDLHEYSARKQAELIRSRQITSTELVEHYLERIARINPPLNAVVVLSKEQALAQAKEADEALARGELRGPLHGIPMTIKEAFETVGMATTSGSPRYRNHIPTQNADAVQRLVDAGAIIMGKTNVPLMTADLQSFNKLYGTTNNPWNLSRTPGGSSGGSAAALAARLTPLELGSDIGGSIRTPSHFCGIYGHKPSRAIVSMRGHIPGPPGSLMQPDLAEAGPMATCAEDLELMLKIVAGPRITESAHWKLELPEPKAQKLQDYKVGLWIEDPLAPIDDELKQRYQQLYQQLKQAGVQVEPVSSPLLRMERLLPVYFYLLGSMVTLSMRASERRQLKSLARAFPLVGRFLKLTPGIEQIAHCVDKDLKQWLYSSEMREAMRHEALELFSEYDVILTPVTPTVAIPHDQRLPLFRRQIQVNGRPRPYSDQFCWIALATALGLPATSAPIGLSRSGLPINVQIIGGHGQDLTTIRFAQELAAVTGSLHWDESRLQPHQVVA